MRRQKITDQSPVIRLPDSHHRRAKAWAALQGISMREAMCRLIDQAWATIELPPVTVSNDARQGG